MGAKRKYNLLKYFKTIDCIYNAKEELLQVEGIGEKYAKIILKSQKTCNIDKHLEFMIKHRIEIISIQDKEYPRVLRNIYDPPVSLYIIGNKQILNNDSIAIIGCRECSQYGSNVAKELAYNISKQKINIVSGLAKGIDSMAHKGTILAKGKTIAVLGNGLDTIYPAENAELAKEIIKNGGAIISEYPLGEKPQKQNFPERNRIVSGMSKGIIVVEAKEKSGTLITVDFALEQGRDVFVVPGNINQENSKGTNDLIKQGAKIITHYKDVLEEYRKGEEEMNYYLDFDYTLFDTYSFREELYKILEMNGLDSSVLPLTVEKKDNSQKLLNIKEVFKKLSSERNIPLENFMNPLEKLYERGQEYLYKDSVEFLEYLKSKGHKLYTITWGEKEYQEEKLKISKIYDYFDEIIYAETLKYELDNVDYKNGIFIDDSVRDLEGLYERNAKQLYRIKRKNGKNSNKQLNIKGILEFNSLKELQEHLEN